MEKLSQLQSTKSKWIRILKAKVRFSMGEKFSA